MKYTLLIKEDETSKRIGEYISKRILLEKDEKNPDIVISVGGDGTILQAAHTYPNKTIFGLHTGHLGFFANYNPDTVDDLISDINSGNYMTSTVDLLSCKIEEANGNTITMNALNEITVISPKKTLIMDVKVDKEYLETFRGTGLCVSTPSGSTAYNKSLHGAVVDHSLKCMQLAEIASINSNAYRTLGSPLVLSYDRIITLESSIPLDINVSIDHLFYTFSDFRRITFFYKGECLKMGYHKEE
ncbi:MAG: NAD kinase [Acholeplasmatales bacterium]|nr:NAD kinase [Acholeplasmatales bacterium]